MELDAVEARLARPPRRRREEAREDLRELADVGEMHVPDALAVAVVERLELAVGQHGLERLAVRRQQELAHRGLGRLAPALVVEPEGELAAQGIGDLEVAAEKRFALGPPAHREEVEHLDEEARPAAARLAHGLDEAPEPRDEPVIADPQERPARDVADAGRLDDEDARLARGEARVPVEDLGRDEAVVGGAPGDHRRHPGAVLGDEAPAERDRREPARPRRLLARRPARGRQRVADASVCSRVREAGFSRGWPERGASRLRHACFWGSYGSTSAWRST